MEDAVIGTDQGEDLEEDQVVEGAGVVGSAESDELEAKTQENTTPTRGGLRRSRRSYGRRADDAGQATGDGVATHHRSGRSGDWS